MSDASAFPRGSCTPLSLQRALTPGGAHRFTRDLEVVPKADEACNVTPEWVINLTDGRKVYQCEKHLLVSGAPLVLVERIERIAYTRRKRNRQ